ncbi:hypothetical protein HPK19_25715 (plasmid) [Arthrobacter citreus]|nr:hypothetical protein HPK19_25715 [Arthrobacter citreus]
MTKFEFKKKYVQKMWLIHDVLFMNKEQAEEVEDGKDTVREVFVGIDEGEFFDKNGESAEFFGSWIYRDEKEAQKEVDEYNQD